VPLLSLAWGVGQIALPFAESRHGAIQIFGLSLPLQADSTIVASLTPSLPLGNVLNVKVEQIAPSAEAATREAAALATLVTLARGIAAPLADNTANNGWKQLLSTATVDQHRNRVVVTAVLPPAQLAGLAEGQTAELPAPSNSETSK